MNKTTATVLLAFSNILVTLVIGLTITYLFIPLDFFAALIGIVFLVRHAALSIDVYKRFDRRYGISARRYVLYAALPSAVLSVLGIIVMYIVESNYITHPGLICAVGIAAYSLVNLIVLSVRFA